MAKELKLKLSEKNELELLHEKADRRKAEIQNYQLQVELSEKQLLLIDYMVKDLKTTIIDLKNKKRSWEELLKQIVEDKQNCVEDIKKRLKLKEDFGYNPDTLEVIT